MTIGDILRELVERAEPSPVPLEMKFDDQTDSDYDWNVEDDDGGQPTEEGNMRKLRRPWGWMVILAACFLVAAWVEVPW